MGASVLIAGIGNIFYGDDAFGVCVAQQLSAELALDNVRVMEAGIRSIDVAFALLDPYDLIVLVDTTQRGGSPGTLYTMEIRPDDMPEACDECSLINSHGLDPVRVLALAKTMGAELGRVLLVACEPQVLDHTDTGFIGLSGPVQAAVGSAVDIIRGLVQPSYSEAITN